MKAIHVEEVEVRVKGREAVFKGTVMQCFAYIYDFVKKYFMERMSYTHVDVEVAASSENYIKRLLVLLKETGIIVHVIKRSKRGAELRIRNPYMWRR